MKTQRKQKTIFARVMNFGYFGSQKTRVDFIDNYFHEISPKFIMKDKYLIVEQFFIDNCSGLLIRLIESYCRAAPLNIMSEDR